MQQNSSSRRSRSAGARWPSRRLAGAMALGTVLAVGVALTEADSVFAKLFGFLALIMASINIFGGFLVTNRMLAMYKKKDAAPKK